VQAEPITYEDFLPVSAAGIFQSNLGGEEQKQYQAHAAQQVFEAHWAHACMTKSPCTRPPSSNPGPRFSMLSGAAA
jgi:uncharacterized glyoxalase superfamily metalloenzyme YdcJ